ncbi:MAG: thioesterase family protein [Tyzzerella sp.]|uniref:Thioesterase family protein n=1 Tax=Candidatus Fimicola merdigallinarum TaxID=2840819 RepID=A0A9D9DW72_9FIRM|nr:thioesterase family protein [Candidatus Fimicola merdigallinarum]
MDYNVTCGINMEIERVVTSTDTAIHFGSGEVTVLATPVMIGWMEAAALNAVKAVLPEGYDTVGTSVNISHIAATPVGMKVRITAEVIEVNGRMLTFKVEAFDELDKIGEGTHGRAIIETQKFLNRVNNKGK